MMRWEKLAVSDGERRDRMVELRFNNEQSAKDFKLWLNDIVPNEED